MALPKEPRQLMINLMYLVLTALLALNVSNEILNAFQIVDNSIVRSTGNTTQNTSDFYALFQKELSDDSRKAKALPLYNSALEIKAESDKLFVYIESMKQKVIAESGGMSEEHPDQFKSPDNIDAASSIFIESKFQGKPSTDHGKEFQQKINDYRTKVFSIIDQHFDPKEANALKGSFAVKLDSMKKSEENPKGEWARGTFYHVPTVGAMTILSKFQNDVRNSENQVVQTLYKQISNDVVFIQGYDVVAAIQDGYVLSGEKVRGKISLVPITTSTTPPSFNVSQGHVTFDRLKNIGMWEGTAGGAGQQTVKVSVSVPKNGGGTEVKTAEMQYTVGARGASMQLDKMNVFYIGVPNPVTVSAAGINMNDVSLSVPGGQLTSTGPGKYSVIVNTATSKGKELQCAISGKTPTGGLQQMGTFPVRVKFLPTPFAKIGGKTGGTISSAELRAQVGITAILEDFDFEAKFQVTQYKVYYIPRGKDVVASDIVRSSRFNEVQKILDMVKPGDRVTFDDIKIIGPDKKVRNGNTIAFSVF